MSPRPRGRSGGPAGESATPAHGGSPEADGGVVVLIPALDEEAALPATLAALPADLVDRVVVVDNGSTDRTAEVAYAAGADVVREPRRGYGSACLAGLAHLRPQRPRPRVVVFVDADQPVDRAGFERLVRPVLSGRADLVLGVRRDAGGGVGTLQPHARLGNRLVLGFARLLFGVAWQDLPPYRAISYRRLEALEMDDPTWGWTLQMQLRAARAGLAVEEVAVSHRRRTAGRSKITGSLPTSFRVGVRMFYTLARERLRRG